MQKFYWGPVLEVALTKAAEHRFGQREKLNCCAALEEAVSVPQGALELSDYQSCLELNQGKRPLNFFTDQSFDVGWPLEGEEFVWGNSLWPWAVLRNRCSCEVSTNTAKVGKIKQSWVENWAAHQSKHYNKWEFIEFEAFTPKLKVNVLSRSRVSPHNLLS